MDKGIRVEDCPDIVQGQAIDYIVFEPILTPYHMPPAHIRELKAASFGIPSTEYADQESLSRFTTKTRRREIRMYSNSHTMEQSIVNGFLANLLDFTPVNGQEPPNLSALQFQQLGLLASGYNTRAIATKRWVSLETVRSHSRIILRELGAISMQHAMRRCFERRVFRISGAELEA